MEPDLIEIFRGKYQPAEGSVPHEANDFLHEFGDVISALLYGTLFVPEFIEVDGSVLLAADGREQDFREAAARQKMPLSQLELSFNYIEVPYIFSSRDSSDRADLLLAEMIAKAWRAHLRMAYFDRKFDVSVLPPAETGHVVEVHFFEMR